MSDYSSRSFFYETVKGKVIFAKHTQETEVEYEYLTTIPFIL